MYKLSRSLYFSGENVAKTRHMAVQLLDGATGGGILVSGDRATPDAMEALRANAGISLASWASSSDLPTHRSASACVQPGRGQL